MIIPFALIVCFLPLVASDYHYNDGGSDWTGACSTGHEQSPIDIHPIPEACNTTMTLEISFLSGSQAFSLIDTGHTLQANVNPSFSTLQTHNVDGFMATYNAKQFHFHAPSEHHVNGRRFALEMHIVHTISTADSYKTSSELLGRTLAVFGLLFTVDDNAAPNPLIDALHFINVGQSLSIDIQSLLMPQIPSPITYYTYKGSLTTPDCNELVNWYVMDTPLTITSDQLAKITAKYSGNATFANGNGNNREVQPLYSRTVRHGGIVCKEQLNYLYVFIGLYVLVNVIMIVMIKAMPKRFAKRKVAHVPNAIDIGSLETDRDVNESPERTNQSHIRIDTAEEFMTPIKSPISPDTEREKFVALSTSP